MDLLEADEILVLTYLLLLLIWWETLRFLSFNCEYRAWIKTTYIPLTLLKLKHWFEYLTRQMSFIFEIC